MKKFINLLLHFPKIVVISFIFLSSLSVFFALNFLKIDTSTDSLINQKLDFKVNQKKLKNEFKILSNNIVIRISSNKLNEIDVDNKTIEVVNILKNRNDLNFVYSPSIDKVFKENFFIFLKNNEKKKLVDKLYDYQPFLSEINNNPRFQGFNNLLALSLKQKDSNSLSEFSQILQGFYKSFSDNSEVDWSLIFNADKKENFVIVGFNDKYLESFDQFYSFLNSLKNKSPNFVIESTGGLVIDFEEIESVSRSNLLAAFLSILIVSSFLWIAFKNLRIILVLISSILIGLSLTVGVTTILVGKLNLISVAFAVLFIGLSVDYGIQIFSRILEKHAFIDESSIVKDTKEISSTLLIASIPSMIGFLSFTPTNYIGLSELGIISFIGLVIGLITNLLFLPSLLLINIKKINFSKLNINNSIYEKITFFLIKNKKIVFSTLVLIFLFNLIFINRIDFQYDAMNLKDQKLESVKLAKELLDKNPSSDYVISLILKEDKMKNSVKLKTLIEKDSIDSSFSILDFTKKYETEELNYLKFLLNSQKSQSFNSNFDELNRFKNLLSKIPNNSDPILLDISKKLIYEIDAKIKTKKDFNDLEKIFFTGFDKLIFEINSLGTKKKILKEDLPVFYKNRYISDNNNFRVEIFPSKDVTQKEYLDQFVNDVVSIYPNATGMPIVQKKAGEVVISSFILALIISFLFLIFFIYFIFKRLIFVFISIICLFIATMCSVFLMIVFNINLNFANMIALPLLYSLGISFPIYFIKRFINSGLEIERVIKSNTPRAIFFSAVTTMGSFSTLSISSHEGTSSMGLLLFICLFMTIMSSIFILPIILKFSRNLIK
jgi:hopanoid biosynthesis associated RND transporter like protein HpnN